MLDRDIADSLLEASRSYPVVAVTETFHPHRLPAVRPLDPTAWYSNYVTTYVERDVTWVYSELLKGVYSSWSVPLLGQV